MTSVRTEVGNETCSENVHHEHLTKTIKPTWKHINSWHDFNKTQTLQISN